MKYDDFIERLKTKDLWHLPNDDGEVGKDWKSLFVEELGDAYEFVAPPMPNRQNAKYNEWKIWFERHFEYLQEGTVLIGCSLGAMFLAKYLSSNELPFRPKAVFLLAGAYDIPGEALADGGDFMIAPASVRSALGKTDQLIIVHSTDDFVVPFVHAEAIAAALPEAEFMVFEDKNHFLIEEFPELVEKIRSLG